MSKTGESISGDYMDDMKLRPAPVSLTGDKSSAGELSVNRRQFMRYGFNTTAGVLAATLGALGFAAILLPPSGGGGGDSSVLYWAKGREEEAWYGAKHLQPMMKSDFESEAANSNVGTAGAQGVWNGLPVIVNYVPHAENSGTPVADNSPRFQEMAGYDIGGNYVGHATEYLLGNPEVFNMSIEINLKITKNKIMMKEKIFNENISYNNTSSQFKLKQTEDKFENSLIRKISEDILIYLRSIEK